MTNLVRRDPFNMDDLFDDFMKGYYVRPMRWREDMPDMRVKMDVKEDDKTYTVHAEMPGVNKEDIHVALEGNTVTLSAEVKREQEKKEGEKLIHSERYYGKVERQLQPRPGGRRGEGHGEVREGRAGTGPAQEGQPSRRGA
jgi:HSP20 family protein